uniref:Uncharacterized protein n=1 Tax=Arundo donax TaxID=35708 RepID=A0A0A9GNR7_ARUDO
MLVLSITKNLLVLICHLN